MCVLIFLQSTISLAETNDKSILSERSAFKTTLTQQVHDNDPIAPPPQELFSLIKYPGPLGDMSAYLSKPADSTKKQAAIIWLAGGFPVGGMDQSAWESVPPSNDQSAKIYRQLGMVMMYPFLRGSGGNPGNQENFLGEVDDVIAALHYLQKLEYIDPSRIYLGGHSTGATLALIVAAANNQFKSVFAFGPVADPQEYGPNTIKYDPSNAAEARLRAPKNYLNLIEMPTFIIEGSSGNMSDLLDMQKISKNKMLHFLPVKGANHFETLAPINYYIASRINANAQSPLISTAQVQITFNNFKVSQMESADLQQLADIRMSGVKFDQPLSINYYFLAAKNQPLNESTSDFKRLGFKTSSIVKRQDSQQQTFYLMVASRKVNLLNLKTVFAISAQLNKLSAKHKIQYQGWNIK